MHLSDLCLLMLTGSAVHGTVRVSKPHLEAVNFAEAIHGRKLTGNLIKEIEVALEEDCGFECLGEEQCESYNFAKMNKVCQLSNSDRFTALVNFTSHENFTYAGIKGPCETFCSPFGVKAACFPINQSNEVRCECADGYAGIPCKAKSCATLLQDGLTSSGVYTIYPDGGNPIQVLCDMITDGGGWTVFQRRLDGSVDFHLDWVYYKKGFGNLRGEFWLGNDNLHRLTAADNLTLRVDLEDFDGNITYAEYTTFKVADEGDKYRLLIGGYSGPMATDSMAYHNNMQFTTKDCDNDRRFNDNCVHWLGGGAWWYNNCQQTNLNGQYFRGPHPYKRGGLVWRAFRDYRYSLKRSEMKVRPTPRQ